MKKLVLIIGLFCLSLQAESVITANSTLDVELETESQKASIAFMTEFKLLHATALREYNASKLLFTACGETYIAIYEQLEVIGRSTNPDLQIRTAEIKEKLNALGQELAAILDGFKSVTVHMQEFNAMPVEQDTYPALTDLLMTIAKKICDLKNELEIVLQQESDLQVEAAWLSQRAENAE